MNAHFIRDANGEEYQMRRRFGTIEERIDINTIPEPMSGCFLWTGGITGKGYGTIWANGKQCAVHTINYEKKNGPIPDGLILRHKCDVRICVNPDHLETGTRADNIADMDKRGRRGNVGMGHYLAKLTDDDVRAIRASSESARIVGKRYGIAKATAIKIRAGDAWKHVK